MIQTDCFAYRQGITNPTCCALKTMVCKEKKCAFYKSKEKQPLEQIEADINLYSSTKALSHRFVR